VVVISDAATTVILGYSILNVAMQFGKRSVMKPSGVVILITEFGIQYSLYFTSPSISKLAKPVKYTSPVV
jgi:hypothetical protein